MRKISILLFLIMFGSSVMASEITDDYMDIAKNYCAQGHYKNAIVYLDKILQVEPSNRQAQTLKHGLQTVVSGKNRTSYITASDKPLMQAADYKLAGSLQNELNTLKAESEKGSHWASYFLGEYYLSNNNPSMAVSFYNKAFKQNANFTQCCLKIAECFAAMDKYADAIDFLNQYLVINNEDDYAYALRAKINLQQGYASDAENDIITAAALNEDITYKYLYGKILYERNNYREAKKILDEVSDEIKTSEIYKYIGLCDYALGDYNNALLNLDKAIILSDDDIALKNKYNEVKSMLQNNNVFNGTEDEKKTTSQKK